MKLRSDCSRWAPGLALAVALALACAPGMARAQTTKKLWVAWTSQNADCRSADEDFYACLLGATQFNAMAAAYPMGSALEWGGGAVVDGCANRDWDCVVRVGNFDVRDDDVVAYFHGGPCSGFNAGPGSPAWPATVHTPRGDVRVRGAELGDDLGGAHSCYCHQALGMHEIFEATGDADNADCCNGQTPASAGLCTGTCRECAPTCDRYSTCQGGSLGWYALACPSGTFRAQRVSPVTDPYGPDTCTAMVVDPDALCAQPRAQREPWRCVGGSLVRCVVTREVQDCGEMGCADQPVAHCRVPGEVMDAGAGAGDAGDADAGGSTPEGGNGIDASPHGVALTGGCGCGVPGGGGSRGRTVAAAGALALALALGQRRRSGFADR